MASLVSGRDTIVALASGSVPSAIAILRVSGSAVPEIARLHLSSGCPSPRIATRTDLRSGSGERLDNGIALFFPGPASYTGEDVLELYLHGGPATIEAALAGLTAHPKTRLAEPGEFTRRAFEAGKMDLTAAEGVADLISAETESQRRQALRQLSGSLAERYDAWRGAMIELLALIEVSVDFPDEEDAPDFTHEPAIARIDALSDEIRAALADAHVGERIRDGFRIALIGAPNAGKSSILNRLARREAAIVTDVPGTTRDIVEVRLDLGGHLVWVADTAGLRESADPVEREGVRRARAAAEAADLRLLVIDAGAPVSADVPDRTRAMADLILRNKIDLPDVSRETSPGEIAVSAKTGVGFDRLEERLSDWVRGQVARAPNPAVTRARHRAGLERTLGHLGAARAVLAEGFGAELAAEDVRRAAVELGRLVGAIGVEDVLGAVFSQFCIGK